MSIFKKHRIRGHLLDKLENLERALVTFTSGTSKGKEIEYFSKDEEKEWLAFHMTVSSQTSRLRKKLVKIFRYKKLTAAEMSRLPDSVREELYPTDEEVYLKKERMLLGKVYSKNWLDKV